MGQKVHPYGFRLGYTKPWRSRWFFERDFDKMLIEDVKLKNELKHPVKFTGFDCPNEFVVGYGLDHAENFRHIPYIVSLQ